MFLGSKCWLFFPKYSKRYYKKPVTDHAIEKKLQSGNLPKKQKKKIDQILSVKKRTENSKKPTQEVDNEDTPMIKFKNAPVIPSTLQYILKHQLGMVRGKRRSSKEKMDVRHHYVEDKTRKDSIAFTQGKPLLLLTTASRVEEFPPESLPEICVIGRSNVGKSSLVNTLTNTAKAVTSDKPGETQSLFWYSLPDIVHLVDLPGYGFSFSSEERKQSWAATTSAYLENRKSLKRCLILIDSRVGFKKSDFEMMEFLDSIKRKYQIVLTKSDLVTPTDLAKRYFTVLKVLEQRKRALLDVIIVSSRTHAGINNLRRNIASIFDTKIKQGGQK